MASERHIAIAHRTVLRLIRMLTREPQEDGGHRVAAITDVRQAARELDEALAYDHHHETR